MYKSKKGSYIFYQKHELRRITLIEVLLMVFWAIVLFINFRGGVHPSRIVLASVIILLVLAKYFAPTFQKKYNATITEKEIILDNIEILPIHLKLDSIREYKKTAKDAVLIGGEKNRQSFEYNVVMDEVDTEIFLETLSMLKGKRENYIRTQIDNAVSH